LRDPKLSERLMCPPRREKRDITLLKAPEPENRWLLLFKQTRHMAGHWWFLPAILVGLTLLVWMRSFAVSVVGWDDSTYLFEDLRLNRLSPSNIWKILTQPFFGNFHPVTTLTYAFDRVLWDTWTPGFHITQLAFYIGGVLVLYVLFKALLTSPWAAFLAAALYTTHASHVESVAWLASRKDVVCLFFYTASILAYLHYTRRTDARWRFYWASIVLGAAAMLSKGYAVILPAILLAYDSCFGQSIRKREILDKLPLIALAVLTVILTISAQDKDSALLHEAISPGIRIATLLQVFACYVGRTLLPVRLSAIYPVNETWIDPSIATLGMVLTVGFAAGFILLRTRLPAAAFGVALFVLPLGTVMNVFFTLRTWMADRYLFFPTIGWVLAFAAGCLWLYERPSKTLRNRRWAIPAATAGIVLLYSALTAARIGVWTNPVLLWSDTLRKQLDLSGSGPVTAEEIDGADVKALPAPRTATWLVDAYRLQNRHDEAEALLTWIRRRQKGPGEDEESYDIQLARLDIAAGRYEDAIDRLRLLAEGNTWLAPIALGWIGVASEKNNNFQAARAAYAKALQLYRKTGRPATPAILELARMEFGAQRFDEAAKWYAMAHEEDPTDPRAVLFLGVSLEEMGKLEKAYRLYEQTLELEGKTPPGIHFNFADVHYQMGVCAEKLGRSRESMEHLEEVLRRAPDHRYQEAIRLKIKNLRGSMTPQGG
jgi:tetratricopeptide (TPR) repeat protein